MRRTHAKYERNVMNLPRIAAMAAFAASLALVLVGVGRANEIKGKVSVQGIKSAENIAVYVDAIADKKFDPPKDHVVVVPTPYFAVTDKDGNFEIKNIPAGKYTLKTWSEDGKPTTQAVDLSGATATVDLTVKK